MDAAAVTDTTTEPSAEAAPDRDLVRSYAREGSEAAFRALVGRHVNLVFAAAFRQAGDAGLAEEITQNVFVALARKAPRLAGYETLAGWLHKTAILEAKARIRADLRRRQREAVAFELAEVQAQGVPAAEDLTPLLDEALMQLREPDRLALVLRFLEERSLRTPDLKRGTGADCGRNLRPNWSGFGFPGWLAQPRKSTHAASPIADVPGR